MNQPRLAVVIPTYRRPALLARLLDDLARQSRLADELWIVDGEGGSADLRQAVRNSGWALGGRTAAILASTRANLPFQRYAGRVAASAASCLLYFDDDVRLRSPNVVADLVRAVEGGAAGATAEIRMGPPSGPRPGLTALLGPARLAQPGSLTASGARVPPLRSERIFPSIEWLRGGAMAFRTAALPLEAYPPELFELAEMGYGLGEDLVLAVIAGRSGELVLAREAIVEHPGDDVTRSYATDPERRGYARAVSRRLLAELRPFSAGRLWTAHAGAMAEALLSHNSGALRYAAAYLRGAMVRARTGRFCPPSGVDWRAEAQRTVESCFVIDRRAA